MTQSPLTPAETRAFLKQVFAEDVGDGDVTGAVVIAPTATLKATINTREAVVIAGLDLAEQAFLFADTTAQITRHAADGEKVKADTALITITGNAQKLLSAERVALNIVQHLSGIATLTRRYVERVAHTKTQILDTRKTIPGLRKLAKYAARMGGATNHRMGLFDAIMIKDNHVTVAGGVARAVKAAKVTRCNDVQVECDTLQQVQEALDAKADSLLLDNMTIDTLNKALTLVDGKIPTEASGGVTLKTVRAIAETGVTYISVGRLTQSARAVDIGLDYSR